MSLPGAILEALRQSDLDLKLPPRRPVQQAYGASYGWASHYGAIETLYNYCRIIPGFKPHFPGLWNHGCVPPWHASLYPRELVYNQNLDPASPVFMARQNQVQALQRIGYRNVHAIGCPICYITEPLPASRLPGSVVFMPVHALDGAPFETKRQLDDDVEYIFSFKKYLYSLFVCLHMSCIRNVQWWPQLLERGIRVIGGADPHDANSLILIRPSRPFASKDDACGWLAAFVDWYNHWY